VFSGRQSDSLDQEGGQRPPDAEGETAALQEQVLGLQQTAGNAAVSRMLRARGHPSARALQREPPDASTPASPAVGPGPAVSGGPGPEPPDTSTPGPAGGGQTIASEQDQQAYQAGYKDGIKNRPYGYLDWARNSGLGLGFERDYQNGFFQGQSAWMAHNPLGQGGPTAGESVEGGEELEGPLSKFSDHLKEHVGEEAGKPDEVPEELSPEWPIYWRLRQRVRMWRLYHQRGNEEYAKWYELDEGERHRYEELYEKLYRYDDDPEFPPSEREIEGEEEEEEVEAE
jgi:hypothetical protein